MSEVARHILCSFFHGNCVCVITANAPGKLLPVFLTFSLGAVRFGCGIPFITWDGNYCYCFLAAASILNSSTVLPMTDSQRLRNYR